jgi:hypothetical protein
MMVPRSLLGLLAGPRPALREVLERVDELERVRPAGRLPHVRRLGHGLGRQLARRLRPRSRAAVWIHPWTNTVGFAPRAHLGGAAAPPAVVPRPTPGSSLRINAGFGCIPVGGRVPVRVTIKQRNNRLKPRVIKIVFFIDRGKHKRVDRRKPYKTRIRVSYKRGSKHRVHARIYFRRKGSSRVQRKTVSKRFTMCR